jgi:hypothetical protein
MYLQKWVLIVFTYILYYVYKNKKRARSQHLDERSFLLRFPSPRGWFSAFDVPLPTLIFSRSHLLVLVAGSQPHVGLLPLIVPL